jgi:hypothetical protein
MSSEKQSKMPDWKERLLQWEQAGGLVEPKEDLLWDKLQTRLQPKRTKRKAYFFRAAAILLFLFAIGFLLFQKRRIPADKPVISKSPVQQPVQNSVVKKETRTPVPIQPTATQIQTRNSHNPLLPNSYKEPIVEREEEKTVFIEPVPEIIEKQEPLSALVAATIPLKKKIRVVHMNELDSPPPPAFAILKKDWSNPQQSEEVTAAEPSILPRTNKHKPTFLPGN